MDLLSVQDHWKACLQTYPNTICFSIINTIYYIWNTVIQDFFNIHRLCVISHIQFSFTWVTLTYCWTVNHRVEVQLAILYYENLNYLFPYNKGLKKLFNLCCISKERVNMQQTDSCPNKVKVHMPVNNSSKTCWWQKGTVNVHSSLQVKKINVHSNIHILSVTQLSLYQFFTFSHDRGSNVTEKISK